MAVLTTTQVAAQCQPPTQHMTALMDRCQPLSQNTCDNAYTRVKSARVAARQEGETAAQLTRPPLGLEAVRGARVPPYCATSLSHPKEMEPAP